MDAGSPASAEGRSQERRLGLPKDGCAIGVLFAMLRRRRIQLRRNPPSCAHARLGACRREFPRIAQRAGVPWS
eukprot:scaffold242653_cov27-Tisochrysis_lutea.AAC.1